MAGNEAFRAATAQDLIKMYGLDELIKDRKQNAARTEQLKKISASFEKFAETINNQISELEDQVDGKISTWFFSGSPSSTTEPEVNWAEEEKTSHIGDIYFDQDTGDSYTYMFINGSYIWRKDESGDASEALAKANKAQDTADRKRQIFVVQPYPPYEVGDAWFKDDKEIYRCRAERLEGEYNEEDWIPASDYTNDDYAKDVEAQLNAYKELVATDYVLVSSFETTVEGIEANVESTTTKIEEVKIDLNDNYYDKGEMDTKTSEIITNVTTVTNKVNELTTDTAKTISFMENIQVNGVEKLQTVNNFTFDKTGLTMDEEGAKTKNIMDNTGMLIENRNTQEEVLFAGYDEELNDSQVRTNNLRVGTYFQSGTHLRIEDYQEEGYDPGTGYFYLG